MTPSPSNSIDPSLPTLAVLCDFPKENWPSMDLVAEMLLAELRRSHAHELDATQECATYRRALECVPLIGRKGAARNVDRLYNRFVTYPRYARRIADRFDLFHLADHSYSQLLHELPAERTGVYLHDLDTFRCLLEPEKESRPKWFKAMARRILTGLQKATIVFHSTHVVREQVVQSGLIDPAKLIHAPLGVAREFTYPHSSPSVLPAGVTDDMSILLHVGSCIPRKRIDVLLDVFAELRRLDPSSPLKLVQAGGTFTPEQMSQIDRIDLSGSVVQVRGLTRPEIASLYRSAKLVLIPSDAEGFGLPMAEALACGAPVVASDLPVLREVGGAAFTPAPVADVQAWVRIISDSLNDARLLPPLETRLLQASIYSWARHARIIADAYLELANR